MILKKTKGNNRRDKKLREIIKQIIQKVVPRLLENGYLDKKKDIRPVIIYGDL